MIERLLNNCLVIAFISFPTVGSLFFTRAETLNVLRGSALPTG